MKSVLGDGDMIFGKMCLKYFVVVFLGGRKEVAYVMLGDVRMICSKDM